ncbi:MAG: hypothetical protein HC896_10550 [Bacteroidales bacterium]|nr:hypothetical protein [Bacteroidales bacterium]
MTAMPGLVKGNVHIAGAKHDYSCGELALYGVHNFITGQDTLLGQKHAPPIRFLLTLP